MATNSAPTTIGGGDTAESLATQLQSCFTKVDAVITAYEATATSTATTAALTALATFVQANSNATYTRVV